MLIDLTVKVSPQYAQNAVFNEKMASFGHLGTHFDVMNKEFSLDNAKSSGIVFDVSHISDRDIEAEDISIGEIVEKDFVMLYTGFMNKEPYGTKAYFTNHPQLSKVLIDVLLDKKVSMIGIDCAGVRRGAEHTPMDQHCADRGVFIVENLCNLERVLADKVVARFKVNTFPVNFEGMTGLPCRVVAEV